MPTLTKVFAVTLLLLGSLSCSSDAEQREDVTTPDMAAAADLADRDSRAPADANDKDQTPDMSADTSVDMEEMSSGWNDLDPLPDAQQESAVVALDRQIFVLGGFNDRGQEVAWTHVYDPDAGTWERRADFPTPAHHMNAVVVGDEIWVIGFLSGGFGPDGRTFVYDPVEDMWSPGPAMPEGRERGSSAVGLIDGVIYLAGGLAGGAVADVDRLDPTTGEWTELVDAPRAFDHAGFGVIDGALIVASGRDGRISAITEEVNRFDPETETWTRLADIPTARGGVASAVLDGKLYVFGGEGNDAPGSQGVFDDVEFYDAATNSWRVLQPMPLPRHGMGAAALDSTIYVPGGGLTEFLRATAAHDALTP